MGFFFFVEIKFIFIRIYSWGWAAKLCIVVVLYYFFIFYCRTFFNFVLLKQFLCHLPKPDHPDSSQVIMILSYESNISKVTPQFETNRFD